MPKQLNINLAFTADTGQAKRQLQDLQQSLSNLTKINSSNSELGITKDLIKAQGAAADLKVALQSATTPTGGLDLSKLNDSFKKSGTNLQTYSQQLSKLGPAGQEAFLKLSQSIISAEAPLKRSSALLTEFKTTLANTARWQISSSILHGFMGTINSALSYARELNSSLTDIGVVTGRNAEQMSYFAETANKAAKSLSATTTQYTKAALIFYQQGLDDTAVEERTNATIKMAHATGDSAEEVSSYMTAIWNNFDDGSESLEHYADVITALGASTASSSSEIASGLQQFAAIAKTTGLSYDYATSALSTLVANTRQSADTIGNSLKTIFSRLQGLSLGETLDDGTNLNKYSKALQKVGVDIKDTSGELRDMDDILDDLAVKWENIERAEKMALAQTVAGTRQYTYLMSLMDNWDDMKTNLNTVKDSDGTLQKQADIYAESWKAARDRVKASAEGIYNDLLDDDFFITFLDGFSKFLDGINNVIDALGGLKGVLPGVLLLINKLYGDSIAQAIDNQIFNIRRQTQAYREEQEALRNSAMEQAEKINANSGTELGNAKIDSLKIQIQLQKELYNNANNISEQSKQELQERLDIVKAYRSQVEEAAKMQDRASDNLQSSRQNLVKTGIRAGGSSKDIREAVNEIQKLQEAAVKAEDKIQKLANTKFNTQNISLYKHFLENIRDNLINSSFNEESKAIKDLDAAIQHCTDGSMKDLEKTLKALQMNGEFSTDLFVSMNERLQELQNQYNWTDQQVDNFLQTVRELISTGMDTKQAIEQAAEATKSFGDKLKDAKAASEAFGSFGQVVVKTFSSISQLTMGITSLSSAWQSLQNPDLSTWEKVRQVIMSLSMGIPSLIYGVTGLQEVVKKGSAAYTTYAASLAAAKTAEDGEKISQQANIVTKLTHILVTKTQISTNYALIASFGIIAAAIAAVVAVVWLVVKAFEAWQASTPEGKLKAAQEEANALAKSLDEAKNSASELQSAFDEYESIIDKLNSCTKGTEEWNEALAEASEKTTELLQKYPQLLSVGNLFDENGLLNTEVLQAELDKANAAVDTLSAATLMAQAKVNEANVDVSKKNFAQNNSRYTQSYQGDQYTNYSAANKDLQTLLDTYKTTGNATLELSDAYSVLGINMETATASEQNLANSLLELANQSIEASNSIDNATQSVINSWAASNNVELEAGQAALMSEDYQDIYNTARDEWIKAGKDGIAIWSEYSSNDAVKKIWDAYNKANGTNYEMDKSNGVRGTDGNREFAYLENGETKIVTLEQVASTIAAAEALDALGDSAENASEILSNIDKTVGEEVGNGIRNWISSGNFESMNKTDFNDMAGNLEKDEDGNYTKESVEEYLKNTLGVDDIASVLGDDWYTNFNSAALNFSTALDHITDNMSENAEKAYNSIKGLEEMSLGDQQQIAGLMQKSYLANGTEGANALVEQINSAIDRGATSQDISDFTTVLNGLNWDTASIADFRNALTNANIDVDKFGISIDEIFDALSNSSSQSLSAVQENYKAIQDIVKDLKTGDTVSKEDYQTLVNQLGADVIDGYFSTMADGTHQLIGDAEDFYNAITEGSRQQMLSNISDSSQLAGSLESTNVDRMNNGNIGTQETSDAAVAYLQTLQLTEEETAKLAEIQDQYNQTGKYTAESFTKLNELMAEHNITEEQYNNLIIQNNQAIRENSEALLSTATSLAELDGLTAQVMANNDGIAYGYSEALIKLASEYDNCTKEIEDYQRALEQGNEETIAAAEDALRASTRIGELSKKYDLVAEDVEMQAKLLRQNRKDLDLTAEEAANLAAANQRMNRGVETLNSNFKDWKKTLNSTDHTTQDYAETLNDAYDALADLTGALDASSIPLDFLDNTTESGAQHLEWLEQAANGDVQAINSLGSALAVASVQAMEFDENFASAFSESAKVGIEEAENKFYELQGTVAEAMNSIHESIVAGMSADKIQAQIDSMGTGWVESLNQMAMATGMSVDQMNSLLNQLGVQAQVEVKDVEQKMKVPTYTEVAEPIPVSAQETYFDGTSTQTVNVQRQMWRKYSIPGPSVEVNGTVQVAQISTAENPKSPTIKYTGTGGASRGGGVSPSSTSGGSRGGRGRGNRGSRARERSNKDPKRHRDIEGNLKELKDEIERYHEINNAIDDVNERIKDYDTIAERAFGKSKINAINKQVKAYKELANTLETKLNENAQYLDQDKNDAKSYGWKFDKSGNVSNYDERMAQLVAQNNAAEERYLAEYNQAVAWWNSLSGDAQDNEGNKKKFENMTQQAEDKLEDAQKLYDKSVEALKTYEETVELREDLLRERQEAINNAIDKELEAVDAIFQARIKVNEADLKLLDELISNLGEGADAAADAIGRMGEKMKYLSNETYAARNGIQSILEVYKDKDLFGDNVLSQNTIDRIINGTANEDDLANILAVGLTEDTIDKLQDYQNQLYSTNESMRELREEALGKTSEAFTEYTDTLGKTSDKITHLQKVTTTYKNIIDIIGKKIMDSTGDLTNQLSRSNWELQRNNTHALKSELNFIDESMNNMKSAIAELQASNTDGVHDVAIKNMQKQLQDMEETRDSTYESWLDSWEAEVQAAADIYQEALNNIVNNFQNSLGGLMGSLDALSEAYNRKSEIDDIYVDDYEKIYNLSKLTRDIEKSIDDTDNIKSKQALRDLLEEMNELQEDGIELSSYDLENARRRYELELAKQKLQEAQEAKSQVRMTRDSEGNYGYIYTADENAVADAEQNYEDKLYAMQKANAEYIQELQNNIISAQQNCADALANLDATQFASYEEFQAAVAQIQEDYNALMEGYYQQINTALDNNQDLYNTEWQEYSDMTGYKISADEDYVDKFEETTYSLLTGYETLQDAQNAWTESVINATNAASEAWFRWYEDNQIALSDGETSMQDYASTVSDVTDTVLDLGEQMEQEAEDLATSYTDSFDTILDALQNFTLGYDSQIEKIISSNNQLQESINKVIRAASNLADATDKNGNTKTNNSGNGSSGNGGNGSSGGSGSGNGGAGSSGGGAGGKASWDRGYAAYKRINAGAWGNGISNRISKGAKEGFTESEVRLGQQIINYTYPPSLNGKGYSLDKAKSLLGYDTGGYTGAWGNSDGKLALLHQKELVLNADDTENFLKAVDIIRDISQTIDLNALSASNSLATMLQSASTSGSNDSQILEQEVHITADFSGVKDRSEIEAAFDNLINRAAQFANRKK